MFLGGFNQSRCKNAHSKSGILRLYKHYRKFTFEILVPLESYGEIGKRSIPLVAHNVICDIISRSVAEHSDIRGASTMASTLYNGTYTSTSANVSRRHRNVRYCIGASRLRITNKRDYATPLHGVGSTWYHAVVTR